ncbi:hypothetical protein KQI65_15410 [bacterium]|nr:hypothetical protein [bacterium]
MPENLTGYIRTPAELDAAARALERSLWQTSSPQKRFLLITQFFSHTRELPDSWLSGYIGFLAPVFIELVRLPYIRSFPPSVWVDAYDFLLLVRRQSWGERLQGLPEAFNQALEQVLLSHAFVSSLRELHTYLLGIGFVSQPLEAEGWTRIFGSSTTGYGLFETYVGILREREHGELALLSQALATWGAFRERRNAVSVILLEEESYGTYSAGRVLPMDVIAQEGRPGDSHLGNLLGDSGRDTMEQLQRAEVLSASIIASRFPHSSVDVRYNFSVHESSAELVGGSLGLAAVAGLLAERTQRQNLPERWELAPTTACSASIDEDGAVLPGAWDSLEAKLRLVFHSPLEKIVIPSAHREAALYAVQMMQREYPNRMLEVIGVSDVQSLPELPGVFDISSRSRMERAKHFILHGNIFLLSLIFLFVLVGTGYLIYETLYDYPNLELTRGLIVHNSSIVYNPRANTPWCFRDGQEIREPVLPFGDIELGDGFTRTVDIWNMTPSPLEVVLNITGADSTDWYINSGDRILSVASARQHSFSVMFAPLSVAPQKRARLVISDAGSGEELYNLDLQGAAGIPLASGYALHFDGEDDLLRFGNRSTAFDIATAPSREFTFECWFRPAEKDRNFLLLVNGYVGERDKRVEDLILGFNTLNSLYYRVGSAIRFSIDPRQRLYAGSWNHIALAVSLPQRRIAIYLNGEVVDDQVTDFIMEGISHPDVSIGGSHYLNDKGDALLFRGDIDEMRVWHSFRTISEVRETMHQPLPAESPELAGYWNMDNAVESIVFNANKRAHSGEPKNRPSLVRSAIPGFATTPDCKSVVLPDERSKGLQLLAGRYLACMRPVLPRFGDASIGLRFQQTSQQAIHFYYSRRPEGWISLEEMFTYTRVDRRSIDIDTGWHSAVMLVEAAGRMRLFIDGKVIDTIRTTRNPPYDWHRNFEGMQVGFLFDKELQFDAAYYDYYHPALNHTRCYAGLHLWNRLLTTKEIEQWSGKGELPRDGLKASWMMDECPGQDGNLSDDIDGALLHVKRVLPWE